MEVPVAEESENFQAREDNCEELNLQDYQLELENRIRNLLWTISGDYTQQMKPDVSLFLRSKDIALYDGIKQGALAKFFDKDFLGMYLVKKIFMGADEAALTFVSQLCIEEAIGERICEQRPGIWEMQRKACEDILDQEYETMPSAADKLGYLRVNLLRRRIDRGENADASNKTITNITEKEQKDIGEGDLQAFVRTKGSDIIHKPALVHQAMAMLAHSHIVEPVFGNDVVQTPQQTKFLHHSEGDLPLMLTSQEKRGHDFPISVAVRAKHPGFGVSFCLPVPGEAKAFLPVSHHPEKSRSKASVLIIHHFHLFVREPLEQRNQFLCIHPFHVTVHLSEF